MKRSIETEGQEDEMTKYERRRFFERLVQLRALYRLRGLDDSESAISIDDAIAYGEHLLSDELALAEVLGQKGSLEPTPAETEPRQI
jgi:hypothetical protein